MGGGRRGTGREGECTTRNMKKIIKKYLIEINDVELKL
jgi:hypothetical protein